MDAPYGKTNIKAHPDTELPIFICTWRCNNMGVVWHSSTKVTLYNKVRNCHHSQLIMIVCRRKAQNRHWGGTPFHGWWIKCHSFVWKLIQEWGRPFSDLDHCLFFRQLAPNKMQGHFWHQFLTQLFMLIHMVACTFFYMAAPINAYFKDYDWLLKNFDQ